MRLPVLLFFAAIWSAAAQAAVEDASRAVAAYDAAVREHKLGAGHNVTLQLDDPYPPLLSSPAAAALTAAARALEGELATSPGHPRARLVLAQIHSRLSRPREAAAALEEHVRRHPRDAAGWNALGVALARTGDEKLAARRVDCYRKATELDPNDASAWANLSNALASAGKPKESVEAGKRAVALRPGYVYAWMNLGVAYGLLGDWPNEEEAYLKSIQVPPTEEKCPFARFNLALGYEQAGKLTEAVKWYEAALRVGLPQGPKSRPAAIFHHNLARALFRNGALAESVREATAAIRIDPTLPEPYSLLGHLFQKSGDETTARKMFVKATKLLKKHGPSTAEQPQRHGE